MIVDRNPTETARDPSVPFHVLDAEECLRVLDTSPQGLTTAEATRRLGAVGPNELEAPDRASPWALLAAQFKNVLIIVLLIAVALSAALGHGVEAIIIGIIVVFAALLGFVQEYRAERAMEALREMAAPTARVLRDGEESVVRACEVVPGDVVLLQVGDRTPADLRILEAVNLQADEAPLTGESMPVEKCVERIADPSTAVADRRDMAYSGTVITYGRGRGVVAATGMRTEFGKIAGMLRTVEVGRTPLQKNLDHVIHLQNVAHLKTAVADVTESATVQVTGAPETDNHGKEGVGFASSPFKAGSSERLD